jgi:hypothetical protein
VSLVLYGVNVSIQTPCKSTGAGTRRAEFVFLKVSHHFPTQRSHGVTVSTLDSESSDRGSNPRESFSERDYHVDANCSLAASEVSGSLPDTLA